MYIMLIYLWNIFRRINFKTNTKVDIDKNSIELITNLSLHQIKEVRKNCDNYVMKIEWPQSILLYIIFYICFGFQN